MKIIVAALCTCLFACTLAESGELEVASAQREVLAPVPVTTWSDRNPVVWPARVTRIQIFLRRGEDNAFGQQVNALALVVCDGAVVTQALRVPLVDGTRFLESLNRVFAVRELPGSEFSHSIAGSFYVGPRPGPIGDELDPRYVTQLLDASGQHQAATLSAVAFPL